MSKTHKRKGFIAQFGVLDGAEGVAEELGNMTAAWSFLENQLALVLKQLTDMSEEAAFAIMHAQNATSSRIAVIQQLLQRMTKGEKLRTECEANLAVTISLMNRRNSLTHHLWVVDRCTGKAYTFDYRTAPDTQARRATRTPSSLHKFTNEILENCRAYAVQLGQEPSE